MSGRLDKLKRAGDILIALVASICFGASFGYNFGIDNQVVYMASALKVLDPTLFKRDWFLSQTTQYHPTYRFVSAALIAIDQRGWAVGIAQNLVIAAGMMSVYWLLRELAGRRAALPSYLLL